MGKEPFYKNKKFLVSSIGLFMILIMVLSVLNMGKTETQESVKYKDYKFVKQGDSWVSYINNEYLSFEYLPNEVENITLPNYNFNTDKIYLAYSPTEYNQELFVMQTLYSWLNYFKIKPVLSCYEAENCPDIPLIECMNDNSIKLIYSNESRFYLQDKCLVLQGDLENQKKFVYKLAYTLLGVL